MKVWAVSNQKGGVGKTTTSVTLAGLLAARGYPTLLVDLDPHGSLSSYFGLDPDTLDRSVYQLFEPQPPADPDTLLVRTREEGLWLLPASAALATLERSLGPRGGMGLVISRQLRAWAGRFDGAINRTRRSSWSASGGLSDRRLRTRQTAWASRAASTGFSR